MIIDFHMHERTHSLDSRMNLREIVREARIVGLDGVCITDHDAYGLAEYAALVTKETGFPIFVGIEYLAWEGDILAFGFQELPALHQSAQAFIDEMDRQGAVTISAHPFRSNSRGLGEDLLRIRGLTGVEVLNGSTSPAANRKALDYCQKLGLQMIGASDAHNLGALGRFATEVPGYFTTVEELVEALKTKRTRPVLLSGYRPLDPEKDL